MCIDDFETKTKYYECTICKSKMHEECLIRYIEYQIVKQHPQIFNYGTPYESDTSRTIFQATYSLNPVDWDINMRNQFTQFLEDLLDLDQRILKDFKRIEERIEEELKKE